MRSDLAIAHLGLRLRPLNRALREAVRRQAAEEALLRRPDLTPYCITDEQVARLLDRVDALDSDALDPDPDTLDPGTVGLDIPDLDRRPDELLGQPLTGHEQAAELRLRKRAAAAGVGLPLDELAATAGLAPVEQDMLLLCAAPELDRGYERITAYVLDDLNRRFPCVELLCTVGAATVAERLRRRRLLGLAGRLRRHGLLRTSGEGVTALRQELRVTPAIMEFLLGGDADIAVLAADPRAVEQDDASAPVTHPDHIALSALGRALRSGPLEVVGLWGSRRSGLAQAAVELAAAAGAGLHRLRAEDLSPDLSALRATVAEALGVAAGLGAILWIDVALLEEPATRQTVADLLSRSRVRLCLTGAHPWRPPGVLNRRPFAELEIPEPGYRDRRAVWTQALPEAAPPLLDDLAARYRMDVAEIQSVAALARSDRAAGRGNGSADACVRRAVSSVASSTGSGFAHAVAPRRGIADLVLPAEQQGKVLEILTAFRHWPRLAEEWEFGRYPGSCGVRALFAGESGTGKTLAAEVVAGALGLMLLMVDLSCVVSKWVGETEKHLEAIFQQAEDAPSVLFFDEADALFGKRGEIKHGVDRYANLEVGYLLQRLERSDSLVIMASNLQENIDKAFTRRFQHVVHFPRPGRPERERLWRLALPAGAPLDVDVDLPALAALDLTGAGIAAAARSAALLAADAAAPAITMRHLVQAVVHQHQREARLLRPEDLGRYAPLMGSAAHA